MSAAGATEKLRVCALVFDNDYKHPVVLAKELATMDLLSDGRVEIGLGAGWMVTDYEQSGIPYDSPGVRIDRFVEGLHGLPKPVQARPPNWWNGSSSGANGGASPTSSSVATTSTSSHP